MTRCGYIVDRCNLSDNDIRELTVTSRILYPDDVPISFKVFLELEGLVAVPRYWASAKFGPAKAFVGNVKGAKLSFEGELRSAVQEGASERSVKMLRERGGGVLCLPTGAGKTVVALHAACKLRVKTLVVVHKTFLMDQWADRISQFVPSARVGRVRQGTTDVAGCDIVIAMLQSVAMRDYGKDVFEGFGLVVFDEVHVIPAPVFSRALFKVCSPCMLGMSATPERRDGLSCVISWFIGPMFMEHKLANRMEVGVFVVPVRCSYRGFGLGGKYNRAAMVSCTTKLCNSVERNSMIIGIVCDLVAAKRRVIVLSDRRGHCMQLCSRLSKMFAISCMPYIGGMSSIELKESEGKDVMLATYAMAKEGLDVPGFNAVVLASPRSDVVQACGRVMHSKSKSPIIVDIADQWALGKAMFNKRHKYYVASGFTVAHVGPG